jgi:hypothetical protein
VASLALNSWEIRDEELASIVSRLALLRRAWHVRILGGQITRWQFAQLAELGPVLLLVLDEARIRGCLLEIDRFQGLNRVAISRCSLPKSELEFAIKRLPKVDFSATNCTFLDEQLAKEPHPGSAGR